MKRIPPLSPEHRVCESGDRVGIRPSKLLDLLARLVLGRLLRHGHVRVALVLAVVLVGLRGLRLLAALLLLLELQRGLAAVVGLLLLVGLAGELLLRLLLGRRHRDGLAGLDVLHVLDLDRRVGVLGLSGSGRLRRGSGGSGLRLLADLLEVAEVERLLGAGDVEVVVPLVLAEEEEGAIARVLRLRALVRQVAAERGQGALVELALEARESGLDLAELAEALVGDEHLALLGEAHVDLLVILHGAGDLRHLLAVLHEGVGIGAGRGELDGLVERLVLLARAARGRGLGVGESAGDGGEGLAALLGGNVLLGVRSADLDLRLDGLRLLQLLLLDEVELVVEDRVHRVDGPDVARELLVLVHDQLALTLARHVLQLADDTGVAVVRVGELLLDVHEGRTVVPDLDAGEDGAADAVLVVLLAGLERVGTVLGRDLDVAAVVLLGRPDVDEEAVRPGAAGVDVLLDHLAQREAEHGQHADVRPTTVGVTLSLVGLVGLGHNALRLLSA